jgi:hypothetical protein
LRAINSRWSRIGSVRRIRSTEEYPERIAANFHPTPHFSAHNAGKSNAVLVAFGLCRNKKSAQSTALKLSGANQIVPNQTTPSTISTEPLAASPVELCNAHTAALLSIAARFAHRTSINCPFPMIVSFQFNHCILIAPETAEHSNQKR